MPQYQPPLRIDRRDGIGRQPVRRLYDVLRESLDDRVLRRQMHWSRESLEQAILPLAEAQLQAGIKEWLRQ
jgi:hypothetical protein